MRWQGRQESDNVEDRREQSSDLDAGGGFCVPVGGKGGIAILVVVLVAGYYDIDLSPLLNDGDGVTYSQTQSANISPKDNELAKFTSVVLASTEDNWNELFQRMGKIYQPPKLVMYRRRHAHPLWYWPGGDGAILFSSRQNGVYRLVVLSRHENQTGRWR